VRYVCPHPQCRNWVEPLVAPRSVPCCTAHPRQRRMVAATGEMPAQTLELVYADAKQKRSPRTLQGQRGLLVEERTPD
jgi:hypothetical protein